MDCLQICTYAHLDTRDPWIAHKIHGLSHEVQIHGLCSAIRGLRKSILCAQYLYYKLNAEGNNYNVVLCNKSNIVNGMLL